MLDLEPVHGYEVVKWSAYGWYQVAVEEMCYLLIADSSFGAIEDYYVIDQSLELVSVRFVRSPGR